MARPLRIEYEDAWYHVMNRGLARRPIFLDAKDYKNFLFLLKEITETFSIEIHAYSLMPNHYHLLIHTPKKGLSRAMRHLNGIYTQFFNRCHRRDGPLFRGRYKACIVDSNAYLVELVRYIHLNPVKAKICRQPKEHQWTSHRYYLQDDKGHEWLYRDEILNRYGKSINEARKKFDIVVRSKLDKKVIKEIEKPKNGMIGGEMFKQWIDTNFVEKRWRASKEISRKEKEIKTEVRGKDLLENIQHCYDMSLAELRQTKRGQNNEARSLAIYLMRKRLGYSMTTIGRWLNTENEYAIAKALGRFKAGLEGDRNLLKRIKELERVMMRRACP